MHGFRRTPSSARLPVHAFRHTAAGARLPASASGARLPAHGCRRTASGARCRRTTSGARLPVHGFRRTASGARLPAAHGTRDSDHRLGSVRSSVRVCRPSIPRAAAGARLRRALADQARGGRGGPPREGRHCQVNHLTCAPGSHLGTH